MFQRRTRNLTNGIKRLASIHVLLFLATLGALALPSVQIPSVLPGSAPVAKAGRFALRNHNPRHLHERLNDITSTSDNWAGYALTAPDGSVTDVQASWVVPSVTCPTSSSSSTSPSQGPYASFWTGIDGWSDNTVEQIGTDSDCVNLPATEYAPTYYAWFEFYPQNSYLIGSYSRKGLCESDCITPGDIIFAEVSYTGTRGGRHGGGPTFKLTITDVTHSWTFTTSSTVSGAKQTSAEWIAETPYGCSTMSKFCLLSQFAPAGYGQQYAAVPNGNGGGYLLTESATIGGVTGAISNFPSSVQESILVDAATGKIIMAEPNPSCPQEGSLQNLSSCSSSTDSSDLQDNGASFPIDWYNAGP
jgi:Peptidase A4 family